MKIQILAMIFIAMLAFSACSNDNHNDGMKVPEAISQALTTKYPSVTHVVWSQKGVFYVAACRLDGHDADVWLNAEAQWQLTETEISWNDVPGTVQTTFMGGEYATWTRGDVDLLEYPLQPVEYVIEVEKGNTEYQLFYSEEGNLIVAKDVTEKDDTHWPK